MINELFLKKSKAEALNEALRLNGIQIELYRKNEDDDWHCDINTIEHDKQIRAEVIEDLLKQVKKEEMWLFEVIGSNQNINIAFGGIYAKAEQLKEQNK